MGILIESLLNEVILINTLEDDIKKLLRKMEDLIEEADDKISEIEKIIKNTKKENLPSYYSKYFIIAIISKIEIELRKMEDLIDSGNYIEVIPKILNLFDTLYKRKYLSTRKYIEVLSIWNKLDFSNEYSNSSNEYHEISKKFEKEINYLYKDLKKYKKNLKRLLN